MMAMTFAIHLGHDRRASSCSGEGSRVEREVERKPSRRSRPADPIETRHDVEDTWSTAGCRHRRRRRDPGEQRIHPHGVVELGARRARRRRLPGAASVHRHMGVGRDQWLRRIAARTPSGGSSNSLPRTGPEAEDLHRHESGGRGRCQRRGLLLTLAATERRDRRRLGARREESTAALRLLEARSSSSTAEQPAGACRTTPRPSPTSSRRARRFLPEQRRRDRGRRFQPRIASPPGGPDAGRRRPDGRHLEGRAARGGGDGRPPGPPS